MNQMPLLPRSCELLVGGLGERNSRWSWTSPKFCLVISAFSPPLLARLGTVSTPFATGHSLRCAVQASSERPSNNTIASEGAPPGCAAGVTTLG